MKTHNSEKITASPNEQKHINLPATTWCYNGRHASAICIAVIIQIKFAIYSETMVLFTVVPCTQQLEQTSIDGLSVGLEYKPVNRENFKEPYALSLGFHNS